MKQPPHTIDAGPDGLREDFYVSRNNFLYLLLGLISTAEDVLGVMPEIASSAVPPEFARRARTPAGAQSDDGRGSSLFR
ncbi:hypothetical protein [Paraburkholderia caballeronis]|uniref:Uncharacterized protein n=1 Tax=Paraburkholderia caballeronis TaxID=416943 RepID=A0A1H7LBF8_9BURK|nr:hypothetical protein [Paraburkholderia caballeronis]PXW28363.1 hypothetical protein C7403_102255 [Paraburkholderia caballeronis]PXX03729.1 hypothetical protein C7407_102255 [Paraburkholderia caballeronis]RAK04473.1 hypothetical protein C7409_102255 [Paraburkholderia caballeronis]TDV39488.1 hypothetical protein C7405_101607 [Paraburkholderia caballeronis]SED78744.1 hypothetical protein SAMN05445871_3920 [Paraburkholderia caballeronis]